MSSNYNKVLNFLLLIIVLEFTVSSTNVKLTSLKCSASNRSIRSNFKCFAKPLSRHLTTANIDLFFTRELKDFNVILCNNLVLLLGNFFNTFQAQIHVLHSAKYFGSKFNTVINSTIDACRFFNGTGDTVVTKWIYGVVDEYFPPNFFLACPYCGHFKRNNVSFTDANLSPEFLNGRYKIVVRFFDSEDENIATVTFVLE